ncbi:MAG: hypothetical protein HC917_26400, partial [Richelia sp. SM2_1_7]|nr:hypothetical protein [Richelia sp. SM2_1_7]
VRYQAAPHPGNNYPSYYITEFKWGEKGNNYQLPITNYQLPITHYQLPITNYQLPII